MHFHLSKSRETALAMSTVDSSFPALLGEAFVSRIQRGMRFSVLTGKIALAGIPILGFGYFLRPEMAGPISHVMGDHHLSITAMLLELINGPIPSAVAVLLLTLSLLAGIAKRSPLPLLSGVACAGFLYYGPAIMSSVLYGSMTVPQPHLDAPLYTASRLAIAAQHQPLTTVQQKTLVSTIFQFQQEQAKATPERRLSRHQMQKLEYRLAYSLPLSAKPAGAKAYIQRFRSQTQEWDSVLDLIRDFDGLTLFLFLGAMAYAYRNQVNLNRVGGLLQESSE